MRIEAPPQPFTGDSAGAILSAERSNRNVSVGEVCARLRLAAWQVEALESDDFKRLGGTTFVRGIIRNYAKMLEIDPQPALDAYSRAVPPDQFAIALPQAQKPRMAMPPLRLNLPFRLRLPAEFEWRRSQIWALAGVSALLAAGVAAWYGMQRDPAQTAKPVEAPQTAQDFVQPAINVAPPPEPEPGTATLSFTFGAKSWVQVRDASGKQLLARVSLPGSSETVTGRPPFTLVIGNASSVKLVYRGEQVELKPHSRDNVARFTLK